MLAPSSGCRLVCVASTGLQDTRREHLDPLLVRQYCLCLLEAVTSKWFPQFTLCSRTAVSGLSSSLSKGEQLHRHRAAMRTSYISRLVEGCAEFVGQLWVISKVYPTALYYTKNGDSMTDGTPTSQTGEPV